MGRLLKGALRLWRERRGRSQVAELSEVVRAPAVGPDGLGQDRSL